jgi:cation transport regulator
MPFKTIQDLPPQVRQNIPQHAEEIFLGAFNSAWDQYDTPEERRSGAGREEVAFKVAWAAVKKKYRKNEQTGKWEAKKD